MSTFQYELVQNETEFPVILRKPPAQTAQILRHWHPEIELNYTRKGITDSFWIEGNNYQTHPGDILYINPYEIHGVDNLLENSYDDGVLTILIPVQFIDKYFPAMKHRKITQQFLTNSQTDDSYGQIIEVIENLMTLSSGLPNHLVNAKIVCTTLQLLILYYENYSTTTSEENKDEMITSLISYLHENFNKPIRLSELANTFYLSDGYLTRYFKKRIGLTIFQYLESIRAFQALDKLKEENMTVEEIALEVGFVDSKALNKAMKKYYGQTAKYLRGQDLP
ncbi:AraC family transcriptional regulator [Marinilactibacillus psychrotolerans]|uniref:AraC family transcriptional regulator n=1 Tax=Marinilactibacillus psychrotolerans TaxID=191770 RepID=UPI0039B09D17